MVKEAGLSKALRMDFADVLVNAEEAYHMTHSIYILQYQHQLSKRTLSTLGVPYYEPRRDWSTEGSGNLLGILADASATRAYIPKGIVDALLAAMATRGLAD